MASDETAAGRGSARPDVEQPSLGRLANEALVGVDLARLLPRLPGMLARRRSTTPRDVLVVPGWLTGDASTTVLRAVLTRDGHRVRGWERGRNVGDVGEHVAALTATVRARASASGRAVDLVGWSLGGVLVRAVASRAPEAVRRIVTMGTPVHGPTGTVFAELFPAPRRPHAPPPVPTTVIWSRRDGVVAWPAQVDRDDPWAEHVEVRCRHLGYGLDPTTLTVVRERVAAEVAPVARARDAPRVGRPR